MTTKPDSHRTYRTKKFNQNICGHCCVIFFTSQSCRDFENWGGEDGLSWNTRLFTAVGWFSGRSVPRPPSSEGCYYTREDRDITRKDRSRRNWEIWDKAERAICLERNAHTRWQTVTGLPSGNTIQPVDFFPFKYTSAKVTQVHGEATHGR
jgi:hypothetical protein